MPYIDKASRDAIELQLKGLDPEGWTEGELAFALFRIWDRWTGLVEANFKDYATLSGVVAETLAEWRRRRITPYEKKKIKENGDVA